MNQGTKKELIYPSTFAVVTAVGKVTFLEIIRERVLYNVLVCAFLLLAMAFLASRLSFLRPDRMILDLGLTSVSLSCCLIGILTGSSLLPREFDRRTFYVASSRPITRAQFMLGKFVGLVTVIGANWVLLSTSYLVILTMLAEQGTGIITGTLVIALGFSLIQSVLASSVAIFFSTFSTASLSVIISIGLYLVGSNISQLRGVAARVKSPLGSFSLEALSAILPNFEFFNLGTKVTYGLPVSFSLVSTSVLYGVCAVGVLLLFASLLIQRREI